MRQHLMPLIRCDYMEKSSKLYGVVFQSILLCINNQLLSTTNIYDDFRRFHILQPLTNVSIQPDSVADIPQMVVKI